MSLRVKFVAQGTESECGLAVAEIVARYYGVALSEQAVHALRSAATDSGGISGRQLQRAFESAGYFAALYPGSLRDSSDGLYRELDKGRPLIVLFRFAHSDVGHYVVVYGYDANRNSIYIMDPARGEVAIRADRFLVRWEGSGYFTLIAMPTNHQSAS